MHQGGAPTKPVLISSPKTFVRLGGQCGELDAPAFKHVNRNCHGGVDRDLGTKPPAVPLSKPAMLEESERFTT